MKTLRYRGVPVIGFAGYSGSGKTTVMRHLIPALKANGIRSAVVKHAHHAFDIDHPGKDSYELREAGADQILVGSAERWALISESGNGVEPDLVTFLAQLNLEATDVILVEGFRDVAFPKVEIHRAAEARAPFFTRDEHVIAVVSDDPALGDTTLPLFDHEDTGQLADFIADYCRVTLAPRHPTT